MSNIIHPPKFQRLGIALKQNPTMPTGGLSPEARLVMAKMMLSWRDMCLHNAMAAEQMAQNISPYSERIARELRREADLAKLNEQIITSLMREEGYSQ